MGFGIHPLNCHVPSHEQIDYRSAFRRVREGLRHEGDRGGGRMREANAEDLAVQLAYARQVVFVPGYGMATAQAQHALRELTSAWRKQA